ncbi:MAG: hypothetical protein ABI949_11025 [Ilumatobacteraceae bacterium]
MDVLWLLLALALCAGLVYVGYRIEPHRVSKDGTRFLCMGQWIGAQGDPRGRRREVWVTVLPSGELQVDVKRRMHHDLTHWRIEGKSPSPPARRAVYVLHHVNELGAVQRMTLKLPEKSRAIAILDDAFSNRR